jgi:hypothetical protein
MLINKKGAALALLSVVAIAAIVSGILLAPQMASATGTEDTLTTQTADATDTLAEEANGIVLPNWNEDGMEFGRGGMRVGRHCFGGFGIPIEVSEEFEQTVTDIAKGDTDVQNLITEGYNVTSVMPIIKTVVDADGNVVTKATNAVVILEKDTTGHASVMVDIEEAKVTQIVILTRTVIDKP